VIGTQIGTQKRVSGVSDSFHDYKLIWTPRSIRVSVDNQEYFRYDKEANAGYDSWPFDQDFNIIVNTAVGGNWGGAHGIDDSVFPQSFIIDYIRYQPYRESNDDDSSQTNGITWNTDYSTYSKWSMGCDWTENNLKNVQVSGELCAHNCKITPGCTHFSWTTYNGGTCWMKRGWVNPNMAFRNNDGSSVCGYIY
jgi:beta-glucanase (GH16 family)